MAPVEIRGLQHVGIPVTDLGASQAFYAGLGFSAVMVSTFEHPDGAGHVAMMKLGDMVVELYEVPAAALGDIRGRGDGHVDHIAFDVADIETAFAAMKSGGYAVVEAAPVFLPFWRQGCRYFYILGPDGERLEFNQIL